MELYHDVGAESDSNRLTQVEKAIARDIFEKTDGLQGLANMRNILLSLGQYVSESDVEEACNEIEFDVSNYMSENDFFRLLEVFKRQHLDDDLNPEMESVGAYAALLNETAKAGEESEDDAWGTQEEEADGEGFPQDALVKFCENFGLSVDVKSFLPQRTETAASRFAKPKRLIKFEDFKVLMDLPSPASRERARHGRTLPGIEGTANPEPLNPEQSKSFDLEMGEAPTLKLSRRSLDGAEAPPSAMRQKNSTVLFDNHWPRRKSDRELRESDSKRKPDPGGHSGPQLPKRGSFLSDRQASSNWGTPLYNTSNSLGQSQFLQLPQQTSYYSAVSIELPPTNSMKSPWCTQDKETSSLFTPQSGTESHPPSHDNPSELDEDDQVVYEAALHRHKRQNEQAIKRRKKLKARIARDMYIPGAKEPQHETGHHHHAACKPASLAAREEPIKNWIARMERGREKKQEAAEMLTTIRDTDPHRILSPPSRRAARGRSRSAADRSLSKGSSRMFEWGAASMSTVGPGTSIVGLMVRSQANPKKTLYVHTHPQPQDHVRERFPYDGEAVRSVQKDLNWYFASKSPLSKLDPDMQDPDEDERWDVQEELRPPPVSAAPRGMARTHTPADEFAANVAHEQRGGDAVPSFDSFRRPLSAPLRTV
jgi:hypothetical protein|uniref:Uncharacterized protein n=1 Tax=Eutreptiella gymnastica TaxID=73025 RepID=A0A7S4LCT0_9EUGL|mmetsp:Transcript_76748/g.128995  ORF Transcript_76748/g.128995 Transcript_76748/m.128995 type:complete len:653 (+) Transcript_76748:148-2106(+)|eukprot:CAMPEP_0174313068 /NCGR_PEP_ID=MMETSP0810-20121108/4727_1 /TAXON_ID=73025 ORGANISM="Eutreptiella gymnastica-like, Strain CCMP1594" /NCGR_SAMPLE_ID=MMETSP0810 /ASSEMBLY_ACC=CAM_ASM_000659 /LENGTH=652 /DNA_ID=CAMNT_0015421705 /DNA_START=148 /DNA_END=2106 /DNA_ORIENTATION=+